MMEHIKSPEAFSFEITPPQSSDAKDVMDVFYKSWIATYPNEEAAITLDDIEERFKDRDSEIRLQRMADSLLNQPANTYTLVARDKSRVIGICAVENNEESNELRRIYILPEFQGRGVGTKLWSEASKFLDPSKDTFVNVASYNQNAIDFYEKLGFKDTGIRTHEERFRMKSGAIIPEMRMVLKAK